MTSQLYFDWLEPADERLEALLAEELAREVADPAYGLLLIQRDAGDPTDAG